MGCTLLRTVLRFVLHVRAARVLGQGLRSISRRPLEDRHKHARSDRQSSRPLPSIHIHPPPAPPLPPHLLSHTPSVEYRDQGVMHNLHVYQTKKNKMRKHGKYHPLLSPPSCCCYRRCHSCKLLPLLLLLLQFAKGQSSPEEAAIADVRHYLPSPIPPCSTHADRKQP